MNYIFRNVLWASYFTQLLSTARPQLMHHVLDAQLIGSKKWAREKKLREGVAFRMWMDADWMQWNDNMRSGHIDFNEHNQIQPNEIKGKEPKKEALISNRVQGMCPRQFTMKKRIGRTLLNNYSLLKMLLLHRKKKP